MICAQVARDPDRCLTRAVDWPEHFDPGETHTREGGMTVPAGDNHRSTDNHRSPREGLGEISEGGRPYNPFGDAEPLA